MLCDLLCNRDYGVYLVDCQVSGDRVYAGWVYCDSGLPEAVTISNPKNPTFNVRVHIPEDVQGLSSPLSQCFENEPVEFLIDG